METETTTNPLTDQNTATDHVHKAASLDKANQDMIIAKKNRKNFVQALEDGTLSCLPGKNGLADTEPVENIVKGTSYKGITALILKNFARQNNFTDERFFTMQQLEFVNMKMKLPFAARLRIKKGSHGVNIQYSVNKLDENGSEIKDPVTGKSIKESQTVKLFNIEQLVDPDLLIDYAADQRDARYEYMKEKVKNSGGIWHEHNPNKQKEVLTATTSDPVMYLAQYFEAMDTGKDFKVSKEIADEFKTKTKEYIFEHKEGEEPKKGLNPFRLNMLGAEAAYQYSVTKNDRQAEIRNKYAEEKYNDKLKKFHEKNRKSVSDDYEMSM